MSQAEFRLRRSRFPSRAASYACSAASRFSHARCRGETRSIVAVRARYVPGPLVSRDLATNKRFPRRGPPNNRACPKASLSTRVKRFPRIPAPKKYEHPHR